MELWVGCLAGALGDYEYVAKLAKAGFDDIDIEPTRVYSIEDARAFLSGQVSTSMRWPERWKTGLSAPLSSEQARNGLLRARLDLTLGKSVQAKDRPLL